MVVLTEQIIKSKTRLDKLEEVKNLNLWGQELDDCEVLSRLPNLEVLSLSVNRLSTLKDFRHCRKLQELYLRKNDVRDLNELHFLKHLKDLRVLWLSDNPCADHPNYKEIVVSLLPNLQKLDNDDVASIITGLQARAGANAYGAAGAGAGSPASVGGPSPAGPSPHGTPKGDRGQSRGSGAMPSPDPSPGGPVPGGPAGGPAVRANEGGGGGGGAGGAARSTRNILYAVMALLQELEDEDLVYVRREIDQRVGNR